MEIDTNYYIRSVEITTGLGISKLNDILVYQLINGRTGSSQLDLKDTIKDYTTSGKYYDSLLNEQLYFKVYVINRKDTSNLAYYQFGINPSDTTDLYKIRPFKLLP